MKIFQFRDYKAFMKEQIRDHSAIRGYLTRIAESTGCQRSYISQVLHGKNHLTQDQALAIAAYWSLSESETDFFLSLVDLARASTPRLRRRIEDRLLAIKERHENLSHRYQDLPRLRSELEIRYFASWERVAIHLLLGISEFQSPEAIARRLAIPLEVVQFALSELQEIGLARRAGKRWEIELPALHLSKDSPMSSVHALNWRQRALLDAQKLTRDSMHVTVVHTLSRKDYETIRQLLYTTLDRMKKVVQNSPEEDLACFVCDYFRV